MLLHAALRSPEPAVHASALATVFALLLAFRARERLAGDRLYSLLQLV